jgi:hypothetical protein
VSSSDHRAEYLARAIVNRLEDRGLVEFQDAEAGLLVVTRALDASFATLDALEREARQHLSTRASDAQVEEEMRRIASQRGIII